MKDTIRVAISILILAWIAAFSSGCASMNKKLKSLLGGSSGQEVVSTSDAPITAPRFSENETVPVSNDRKYRRMTKQRFEEEAEVAPNAGSLWVMEGQGSYLFAQNTTRLVGDLLNVKMDGSPRNQLQTKTRVIAKLLDRLDGRGGQRLPASAKPDAAPAAGAQPPANGAAPAAPAAGADQAKTDAAAPQQAAAPDAKDAAGFNVQMVPTRIVEVLHDGSYKVKGSQDFMIGKREYRVIVTGVVRQEDFNEEGVSADKLMDSQFDIVSSKRGAATL